MKQRIIIVFLLIHSHFSFAQAKSGLYMNVADYRNGKLTYERDCATQKDGIRLHSFFSNGPYVTLFYNSKKCNYKKSEIYGFRNCSNEIFRFYNNTEYKIVEAKNIFIYTRKENVTQSKGYHVVNRYYFSVSPDSGIHQLTLTNLKSAYSSNEKFLDLIDQFFSDGAVCAYDNLHSTFRINYVYAKTINEHTDK